MENSNLYIMFTFFDNPYLLDQMSNKYHHDFGFFQPSLLYHHIFILQSTDWSSQPKNTSLFNVSRLEILSGCLLIYIYIFFFVKV